MKLTAAALAPAARSTGGLGVVVGAGPLTSLGALGAASVPAAGTTEVVGLATAAGWAGLSRPTMNAAATPTTTASAPATATRRM